RHRGGGYLLAPPESPGRISARPEDGRPHGAGAPDPLRPGGIPGGVEHAQRNPHGLGYFVWGSGKTLGLTAPDSMMTVWLALPGLVMWCATLLLPWQPWRTREREDVEPPDE